MKKAFSFFLTVGFVFNLTLSFAQTADQLKRQKIESSYIIALGRAASGSEVDYWMKQNIQGDIQRTMVENHRSYLQGNQSEKRAMIVKAYAGSYGRNPDENEIRENMKSNYHYTDWVNNHMAWISKSGQEQTQVINRAFQNKMGRTASADELNFWKQKPAAYYVIAACLESCKQLRGTANCLSRTVATGINGLAQTTVSAETANGAAAIINESAKKVNNGSNVVASGGGNVIAAGGGNVVAAGGGNVVAAGGMN